MVSNEIHVSTSDGDVGTGGLSSLSSASTVPPTDSHPPGVLYCIPDTVDWMFHLQNSELFLKLWKKVAQEVLVGTIPGGDQLQIQIDNSKSETDIAQNDLHLQEPLPTELEGNEEETRRFYEAKIAEKRAEREQLHCRAKNDLDTKIKASVIISHNIPVVECIVILF